MKKKLNQNQITAVQKLRDELNMEWHRISMIVELTTGISLHPLALRKLYKGNNK